GETPGEGRRLVLEVVPPVGPLTQDLAAAGDAESLAGPAVRFVLWHGRQVLRSVRSASWIVRVLRPRWRRAMTPRDVVYEAALSTGGGAAASAGAVAAAGAGSSRGAL